MRHRILIVDDHVDAADMSCLLVEALGHTAIACTTGESGLAQAVLLNPDVALLDIGLPDISGYDVARRLRESYGARIFLAAITGWGEEADRVRAFEAGFDHHALKPASGEVIKTILAAAGKTLSAR